MNNQAKGHEFFEQVRREHQQLRELLGQLHHILTDRQENVQRVAQMFASLAEHVQTHFQDEEEGGFFDQIIAEAPRLVERTHATRDQHQALRARATEMAELAQRQTGSDPWWHELNDQFRDFSRDLMHHESTEIELVQEAYDVDLGSQD